MPIMVKSQGTPAEGGVQTSYVIIATGISERLAGEGPAVGEREPRDVHGGPGAPATRDPGDGSSPSGEPVSVEDGQAVVTAAGFDEENLKAGPDKTIRADVHLVWKTSGVKLTGQPTGTTLQSDVFTGMTRLTFHKVLLTPSSWSPLTAVWGSTLFDLGCVYGSGDQVITGFLCRVGQFPDDALASHSIYLTCARPRLSWLGLMLRWLRG